MTRRLCGFLILWASVVQAQTVKMPAEVKTPVGRLAAVLIEFDGAEVRWTTPAGLDVFREYDPDPKKVRLRLIGYTEGIWQLNVVTCKADKLSEFAVCNVIVGKPPDPGPGPKPPPPDPGPVPIPVMGLRVLIIEESDETGRRKLPTEQVQILFSKSIREYLDAHCALGLDAKTKEWRIYDKDVNTTNESKIWQDAMKRPRQSIPWIIISDGVKGFEGPLPATVDKTLELLKKYGGE